MNIVAKMYGNCYADAIVLVNDRYYVATNSDIALFNKIGVEAFEENVSFADYEDAERFVSE